jgi:DNA-binding NarL/FixJ family response regulator
MSESHDRVCVLLIEDNKLLLQGLSCLLSEVSDVELVGGVRSATEGLALFESQRPSVAVVDLDLPGVNVSELVVHMRQLEPEASILILVTYELDHTAAEVIASGAAAAVAKDQIASRLIPLIRSLGRGHSL